MLKINQRLTFLILLKYSIKSQFTFQSIYYCKNNNLCFYKANNSMLCVPESQKSKKSPATKSLSELTSEPVSNVSSKSAVELLRKSYNKLFSSKTKLSTSFYGIDHMNPADEQNLLVPEINNEYLKAPKTKRSRSNSSSLFTCSSGKTDKNKRSSSTKEKLTKNPAVKYSSLDQNNNLNKFNLNTNNSNNEM